MAIYEISSDQFRKIDETTFSNAGLRERQDLQRLLRTQIEIVSPDTLIIAEEFSEWEESNRRIDLLGLDKDANLVVIELKRTEDGGHMELQSIRYAAMISAMTFEKAVTVFANFLNKNQQPGDARKLMLDFLELEEPDEDRFAQDVRIVLVSAEFSKELTTTVIWLNQRGLDIKCVRIKPYRDNNRILADIQQVLPLPEEQDYRVQLREKEERERGSRKSQRDSTKYDVTIEHEIHPRLPKRLAIFLIVKQIVKCGHSPEEIAQSIAWRKVFREANGVLSSHEFVDAIRTEAAIVGREFDETRYFCSDGELIHSGGKTYAFSNQWGPQTVKAMTNLVESFPSCSVSFRVCRQDG